MFALAAAVAVAPIVVGVYAYVLYPAALWVVARTRLPRAADLPSTDWPAVTITLPVYNAASRIRQAVEGLLALEYPRDRLQLLVMSDASTDGTDLVVQEFADRGVQLVRAPIRRGKTAAENKAYSLARGDIVVNVDATVVVPPDSLKKLVRAFADPTVGVASGRDVSIGALDIEGTGSESSYVGYEMWIRALETKVGSIVGASGCFYGVRRAIHDESLPEELSWDFASCLVAKRKGYRSVSVRDAVCIVPRTPRIQTELRRKVRTMARGINTLIYHRALMNPLAHGTFAVMLVSHKLLRWVPYLLAPLSLLAFGFLAVDSRVALSTLIAVVLTVVVAAMARIPRLGRVAPVAWANFAVTVCMAGVLAWRDVFRGINNATWEPTPRADNAPIHAVPAQ